MSRCWRNEDEPFVSNNSINQVQNAPLRPDGTRPGDEDLAGTTLRVTVSDMSAIAPYSAATDLNGITPLYFASATLPGEVLPGKAGQTRTCHILHNDAVEERNLGFNLLPFSDKMELVATSRGVIPHGRRPVEGNYDSQGRNLYHAILYVVGRRFPGMCAEHLVSACSVTRCLWDSAEVDLYFRAERKESWKEKNMCQIRDMIYCGYLDFNCPAL